MSRGWIPLLAVALLVVLPDAAHACPVCFDASAENRMAFLKTAALLTGLPLVMITGTGIWLRKRALKASDEDDSQPL